MTALLTDNLPLLAGAPNGIKKLRELILELAVRGKLVPQDPNDEPASELLKRIAEEKARLVAEGKIKKQKPLPEITDEEKPFQHPTGWEWVRLDSLLKKIGAGSTPLGGKQAYVANGVKFLRSQNVWNEGLRLNEVAFIPEETHQKMSGTHVEAGDLLFNITGASIGRCAAVPADFDTGNVSQHVTIIRPVSGATQPFLHIALISQLVQQTVMDVQVGVSREGLSIGKLAQFLIPFPPEVEQRRIVAKVDELMALCDRLEARQTDADSVHAQLAQALLNSLTQARDAEDFAQSWQRLAEHFHTLFTTESSIDALKQTLLQLAVMGKLVPQDPSDESAMSFLKVNGIEGKPYTLHGWAKAQLGQLGEVLGGSTPSKANSQFWDGNIPWVSPKDMKRPVIHDSEDHVSPKALEETSLKAIPPNSLLMVVRGMILAHSFPVAITAREVTINQDMKALVPPREVSSYLLMYLQAVKSVMVGLVDRSSHGTCKLVSEKLWAHAVLLPPLAEQHRIVAKVDQLMALCDQLKARLNQAHQVHEQLANALVEQAVA